MQKFAQAAKEHRQRVLDLIRHHLPQSAGTAVAYLKGETLVCRQRTDVELPFRQESNFL
jgi:hypothetical protein